MKKQESIADLEDLGPKSREMPERAGITSVAGLRAVGTVPAFARARRANANVSLNPLWAPDAALSGVTWQEVARHHRTSLLPAVEEYEKNV